MKYIIIDWANNVCFDGKEFPSFDDAWEYVRERTSENDWEEYDVVENKAVRSKRYLDPNDPRNGRVAG